MSNTAVLQDLISCLSAALWHPLIPSLHFPYSLSPSPAFLLLLLGQTHAHTCKLSFSPSQSSSHPQSLPLHLLLHLSSFEQTFSRVSLSPFFRLPLSPSFSTCHSHAQPSAPSSQAAALMKAAVLAELNKSACQRSPLRGHLANSRQKATRVHPQSVWTTFFALFKVTFFFFTWWFGAVGEPHRCWKVEIVTVKPLRYVVSLHAKLTPTSHFNNNIWKTELGKVSGH